MAEIKTSPKVLAALKQAATKRLTPQELHDQRISFIMGTLKDTSGITRARVEQVLAAREGQKQD